MGDSSDDDHGLADFVPDYGMSIDERHSETENLAQQLKNKMLIVDQLRKVKDYRLAILKDLQMSLQLKEDIENRGVECCICLEWGTKFLSDGKFLLTVSITNNWRQALSDQWKLCLSWRSVPMKSLVNFDGAQTEGSTYHHKTAELPGLEVGSKFSVSFFSDDDLEELPLFVNVNLLRTVQTSSTHEILVTLPGYVFTVLDLVKQLQGAEYVGVDVHSPNTKPHINSSPPSHFTFSVRNHLVTQLCSQRVPKDILLSSFCRYLFTNLRTVEDIGETKVSGKVCGEPGVTVHIEGVQCGDKVRVTLSVTQCDQSITDWLTVLRDSILLKLLTAINSITDGPPTIPVDRAALTQLLSDPGSILGRTFDVISFA